MNLGTKVLAMIFLVLPITLFSQQKDTLIKKLDSLNQQPTELKRSPQDSIKQEFYNSITKITPRVYFVLLLNDLKQQLLSPFHLQAADWKLVGEYALFTGAVFFVDEPINQFVVTKVNKSNTVVSVSKYVTRFGGPYEAYTLAAFGLYGVIFKNEKVKTTTLLATQAYITSAVLFEATKFITGRQRPSYYDPETHENDPTWHGPLYQFQKDKSGKKNDYFRYSSFPSGHTTVAFAAATVFAMEYYDRPLVPIIAYSASTLIGLSRLTENKHWASDVIVGAAIGYLTGKQVVNNYHRYASIQNAAAKKKGQLSFNIQMLNGRPLPGFVYRF